MKLFSLLAGAILMASLTSYAQNITVIDSANRLPVPGATIVVMDPATGQMAKQGSTDAKGNFDIGSANTAVYLSVTAIGYKKSTIQSVPENRLILLTPDNKLLKEVKIKSAKSPVTFSGNIMEYDISLVPHADYLNLPDIIDQLPFLRVEEKSIKMMNETLKILIDGRANSIYKDAVALKSLPPQAIEKIEVVLTPTARNGGKTLNITLKHDYFLGWNGSVDVSGSRLGVTPTTSVSYWRKKYGFDFSINDSYSTGNSSSTTVVNYLQQQSRLTDNGESHTSANNGGARASGYYNLDDHNIIDMQLSIRTGKGHGLTTSDILTQKAAVLENDFSDITRHNSSFGNGASLNYTHKYHKTGNVFYLLTDFSAGTSKNDQLLINSFDNGTGINNTLSANDNRSYETTFEAVQQRNSNKKLRYTFGSKVILRDNKNNHSLNENSLPVFTPIAKKQLVSTTYVDADWNIKKITMHTGLRFEYNNDNYTSPVSLQQSNHKLTPNVSLTYNIDKINLLMLTYIRGLSRPSFNYTTAVSTPVNAYEESGGSINLENQVDNRWGMQYYGNYKLARLGLNFDYERVGGFLSTLSTLDSGNIIKNVSANINSYKSYTAGFSIDFKFLKNFRFSHNSNYSYLQTKSGVYINKVWSGYISDRVNYQMGKQNSLSVSALAYSPNIELQGKDQSLAYLDWGISYSHYFDFLKSYPTSIGLSVHNPNLYNGFPSYSTVNASDFTKRRDGLRANALIGASIRVQFKGKQYGNRTFSKEKSISNNDLSNGN